jgi:hypothetical protein
LFRPTPATQGATPRFNRMDNRVHEKPGDVTAEAGQVDQDGPDGVAVSYRPGAAVETGHRLIEKGLLAERQRNAAPDEEAAKSD